MSKPRAHRAAAKAKRGDLNMPAMHVIAAQRWFEDWLQALYTPDTAESYQRDAIADANSGTDEMNNRRVN